MTIIERKQLAAHQRRVGPNTVGTYGILQPFADALKLILKENVIPAQSNKVIFYFAPVSSLFCSLLGWGIIPFGPGLAISDFSLGILYTLALSSLGVYGKSQNYITFNLIRTSLRLFWKEGQRVKSFFNYFFPFSLP